MCVCICNVMYLIECAFCLYVDFYLIYVVALYFIYEYFIKKMSILFVVFIAFYFMFHSFTITLFI